MVDPYPKIEAWNVSPSVVRVTLDAIAAEGHPAVEAGVFWLGKRGAVSTVSAVVIPDGDGVEGLPDCWRVAPEVFGRIGAWASTTGISLLGVVHTHGGRSPAELSRRDRTHSIKAPGVLAVVVAYNGDEPDSAQWGWYVWADDDYQLITAKERAQRLLAVEDVEPSLWKADAHGVRPA